MKIYTKTGDSGTTSLVYGERVSKEDIRVEAYGTCDEANSMIGLGVSYLKKMNVKEKEELLLELHKVQTILFHVGAELATPNDKEVMWKLKDDHISELESVMDKWNEKLAPLSTFILPGGNEAGAAFHVARTLVRRAERRAVSIGAGVNKNVIAYLNRLSDFLFVLARRVNQLAGETELTLHG